MIVPWLKIITQRLGRVLVILVLEHPDKHAHKIGKAQKEDEKREGKSNERAKKVTRLLLAVMVEMDRLAE